MKFIIIKRYQHITVSRGEKFKELVAWCNNPDNGNFITVDTNVYYDSEKDLTAFLLRWS